MKRIASLLLAFVMLVTLIPVAAQAAEIDIDNDAVWNDYIKTVEGMGAKVLLENTQAAYDRQTSK